MPCLGQRTGTSLGAYCLAFGCLFRLNFSLLWASQFAMLVKEIFNYAQFKVQL